MSFETSGREPTAPKPRPKSSTSSGKKRKCRSVEAMEAPEVVGKTTKKLRNSDIFPENIRPDWLKEDD